METMRVFIIAGLAAGLLFSAAGAGAAEFFVAPDGLAMNSGAVDSPWDIASALTGAAHSAPAGATIWIRGGTYRYPDRSNLGQYPVTLGMGTSAAPVTVAGYPGERARIDGGLSVEAPSKYLIIRDLEIFLSEPDYYLTGLPKGGAAFNDDASGARHGVKFVNLVIHNVVRPVRWHRYYTAGEVYGCVIYECGRLDVWDEDRRWIVHANCVPYDESHAEVFALEDNILAADSALCPANLRQVVITGGSYWSDNVSLLGNIAYNTTIPYPPPFPYDNYTTAYQSGSWLLSSASEPRPTMNLVVNDNCFANFNVHLGYEVPSVWMGSCAARRNTTLNACFNKWNWYELDLDAPDSNLQVLQGDARPAGARVSLRPNRYDARRANLAIYNWDRAPAVTVAAGGFLAEGQGYSLVSPREFFPGVECARSGWVSGGSIVVPFAAGAGEFAAFILLARDEYYTLRTLRVESSPAAGVAVAGSPAAAGGATNYDCVIEDGSEVVLTAPPRAVLGGVSYDFSRWRLDGEERAENPLAFALTRDATATAVYSATRRTVAVESFPGPGAMIGGSSPGTTNYVVEAADGSTLALTAPAALSCGGETCEFIKWAVDGAGRTPGEPALLLSVSGDARATAQYRRPGMLALDALSRPAPGCVVGGGAVSGTTNYAALVELGAEVSLSCPASCSFGGTECVFVRWELNGVERPNPLAFTMTSDATAAAVYRALSRELIVGSYPVGAVAVAGVPGGTTNYAATLDDNTRVALRAPAAFAAGESDYVFARWRLDGGERAAGETLLAFDLKGDAAALAEYAAATRLLRVCSTPAPGAAIGGIPAGTADFTMALEDNSGVTMTAAAMFSSGAAKYRFARWRLNGEAQPEGKRRLSFNINADTTAAAEYAGVGGDFYIAPDGLAMNSGAIDSPWDIASGLRRGRTAVPPGSTVWVRGGTYRYPDRGVTAQGYVCELAGEPGAPTHLRGYPGERATIDGGLVVQNPATYLWARDLEIMVSEANRVTSQSGSTPGADLGRPWGGLHVFFGDGCKFINLAIHDCDQGVSWWVNNHDSELYGCLIYDNGWQGSDRGHGHCVYSQNRSGGKAIVDCFLSTLFSGSWTMHAYGSEAAYVDNYLCEGNIARGPYLIGGGRPSNNIRALDECLYDSDMRLGYGAPYNVDCELRRDVIVNGALVIEDYQRVAQEDNVVIASGAPRPPGARVSLRPNRYDANRANLAIYNWDRAAAVTVDVTGFMEDGRPYTLLDPKDVYGAPLQLGAAAGGRIAVAMGASAPYKEFDAFVLRRAGHMLEARSTPVANVSFGGAPAGTTNFSVSVAEGAEATLVAPARASDAGMDFRFSRWLVNGVARVGGGAELALSVVQDTVATAEYVPICKGDLDGDDFVDFWDFMRFVDAYGASAGAAGYDRAADFDDDDDVDFWDFMELTAVYHT